MQGSDLKMRACELQIEQLVSCKPPDEQFVSQSVCELWNMSVCTFFQVRRCGKTNLFWRFCWRFLLRRVPTHFLQDMLLNNKVSYDLTNISNILEIKIQKKVQSLKEGSVCLNSFLFNYQWLPWFVWCQR